MGKTMILFPGASPTAEEHPSLSYLASALANIGFNVYIPRIPLLKRLDISDDNVEWFQNAYEQLLSHNDIILVILDFFLTNFAIVPSAGAKKGFQKRNIIRS